ncbi:MAG: DUF1858 domain-containing protein [Acidobacteria bacterium]|nr:DUF1858 domain-containing protein [Acidobacteriota bacterium]
MREELVTPDTRIGKLLSEHPEIEAFLVRISPRFAALKNPIMRRTVGRMATVAQAAAIAGMPAPELVMALRRELGQAGGEAAAVSEDVSPSPRPTWVEVTEPSVVLNGDELMAQGHTPVNAVRRRLGELAPGQVLLLEVSFKPEPLIQALQHQGFNLHAEPAGGGAWKVWFRNA